MIGASYGFSQVFSCGWDRKATIADGIPDRDRLTEPAQRVTDGESSSQVRQAQRRAADDADHRLARGITAA
jgi:hypothetical protein